MEEYWIILMFCDDQFDRASKSADIYSLKLSLPSISFLYYIDYTGRESLEIFFKLFTFYSVVLFYTTRNSKSKYKQFLFFLIFRLNKKKTIFLWLIDPFTAGRQIVHHIRRKGSRRQKTAIVFPSSQIHHFIWWKIKIIHKKCRRDYTVL